MFQTVRHWWGSGRGKHTGDDDDEFKQEQPRGQSATAARPPIAYRVEHVPPPRTMKLSDYFPVRKALVIG